MTKRRSQTQRNTTNLSLESLEGRTLLAGVQLALSGNELLISGTPYNDSVDVVVEGNQLKIRRRTTGAPDPSLNTGYQWSTYSAGQVEQISFSGRNGEDRFQHSYGSDPQLDLPRMVLDGGGGEDRLYGGDKNDVIRGGGERDVVFGFGGEDELYGEGGNDVLHGGGEDDFLCGGEHVDRLYGDNGDDELYGGGQAGDDLRGGNGANLVVHGPCAQETTTCDQDPTGLHHAAGANDYDPERRAVVICGTSLADSVTVRKQGANVSVKLKNALGVLQQSRPLSEVDLIVFTGRQGNDEFHNKTSVNAEAHGGAGNDTLRGGGGEDTLFGDAGKDQLFGGNKTDWLHGGSNADELRGGPGKDHLYGNGGNDLLRGEQGRDMLFGGAKDDSLFGGGTARNTLNGGGGADRFLVRPIDQVVGRQSRDSVINFGNNQTVDAMSTAGKDEYRGRTQDPSDWSDHKIEIIDRGFALLQEKTGNTRLLKDSIEQRDLTFLISRPQGTSWGSGLAFRDRGDDFHPYITIEQWNSSGDLDQPNWHDQRRVLTVVHEISHLWDSKLDPSAPFVGPRQFDTPSRMDRETRAISDLVGPALWTDFISRSWVWQGGDGNRQLVLASGAAGNDFASAHLDYSAGSGKGSGATYGQTTPLEDWGTSWELHFMQQDLQRPADKRLFDQLNPPVEADFTTKLDHKLDDVDRFFAAF